MRRFDTVLFDLDGTLLDTLDDLCDSVNHVLTQAGYPCRSREEVRRFLGYGAGELLRRALPVTVTEEEWKALLERFRAWYQTHESIHTRPYPGMEELLAALAAEGVHLAILSNKPHEAVETLNQCFFHLPVALGQMAGSRPKPAPEGVEEALRRLGCQRERAVYVGDSEVDFHTARNAGLPCVLVSWGFRDRGELEALKPEFLVDSREELLALLTADESLG